MTGIGLVRAGNASAAPISPVTTKINRPNAPPSLVEKKHTGGAEEKLGSTITGVDLVREHNRRRPPRVGTQSPAGILRWEWEGTMGPVSARREAE